MRQREQVLRHLWMNFTRMSDYSRDDLPMWVRGEGPYIFDDTGKKYLDGLSGLFCNNIGHGRVEIAEAAERQLRTLAFAPTWGGAHPVAAELAAKIAHYAPGDLNRVLFTSGGSEAVEAALKLARQYHYERGDRGRYKVISRMTAYHGCTMYATSVTPLNYCREPFEPMVGGARFIPNTDRYRCEGDWTAEALTAPLERTIAFEGPKTISAVIMEPVQAGGGALVAPPGYYERVREICDENGILLIADEVICGWGRIGDWFASNRYGFAPDLLTTAKGLTSAYAPMGALIATDKVMEPFLEGTTTFQHGHTFSGHPLSAAVALANIEILEREQIPQHVRSNEGTLRASLDSLRDIPIVGDVRGAGYLWSIELVRDNETKEKFGYSEVDELLRDLISMELERRGLLLRTDRRGEPAITLSPPLICGPEHFDEILGHLRPVLENATDKLGLGK
ncbi:aspartate aminotransferase family protein [Gordonia sp. SID5947]|nr:aspartate aminotransferase family protein [Gordonia sp. SID5947]